MHQQPPNAVVALHQRGERRPRRLIESLDRARISDHGRKASRAAPLLADRAVAGDGEPDQHRDVEDEQHQHQRRQYEPRAARVV